MMMLVLAAVITALKFFTGSWTCGPVHWSFTPLSKGSPWLRVVYGKPQHPGGVAVFGYVEGLHGFVYRDFHADGSYANLSSVGPVNGTWIWTGPYYPAGGGEALYGRISYVIKSSTQFDRKFQQFQNGQTIDRGGDTCTKL